METAEFKFPPEGSDAGRVASYTHAQTPARNLSVEPNGGFPEPPPGDPIRVVRCRHECGTETAVRLPQSLPSNIVRRVSCAGCGQVLSPEDSGAPGAPAPAPVGATAATGDPPGRGPRLRAWQIASVPLIAAAVVGGVLLFGGSDNSPRSSVPVAQPGGAGVASPGPASFVRRSNFSLALPPGWKSVTPRGGAVYRAVSSDGTADATLWIENDPTLSFGEFIKRSLANLKDLASNATIHQQLPSPTASGTIVQLKGDVPTGNGTAPYLVTLRQSGPYRYYLATSVAPNAPDDARKQAALIHGSFTPEASGNGKGAVSATGPTPGPATGSTP